MAVATTKHLNPLPGLEPFILPMLDSMKRLQITVPAFSALIILVSLLGAALLWMADGKINLLLLVPFMLAMLALLNLLNTRFAEESTQSGSHRELLMTDLTAIASEWIYYFPFVIHVSHHIFPVIAVAVFLFLMICSEYIGLLMRYLIGERHFDGPLPRAGRAMLISIYALFIYFDPDRAKYGIFFFSFGNLLLVMTCYNRLKLFWFSSFKQA